MASAGSPPDFDPSETRAPTVIGVVSFLCTLAATAVGLRVYTRWRLIKQFGIDDGLACLSLVSPLLAARNAVPHQGIADMQPASYFYLHLAFP